MNLIVVYMDYCTDLLTKTSYIWIIPVCWGIYELRQFRLLLEQYKETAYTMNHSVLCFQKITEDIVTESLEEYPFIKKINKLMDKANKIIT